MLQKRYKFFIFFIIALIALLTYLEASEPDPVNWFPSYAKTDKIPLGTFVSYKMISSAYGKKAIKDINQPPYEFLTSKDSTSEGAYLFINNSIQFDDSELNRLLTWVDKGNTLFVSAKNISKNLLDTLSIKIDHHIQLNNISTQPIIELVNNQFRKDSAYLYDRDLYNPYFKSIDTTEAIVLGQSQIYNDTLIIKHPEINYLKQNFGNGTILLHTFPEAFGNYFMLKQENALYTQNVLSYIDQSNTIYWDNYYKAGKTFYTALYILLNNRYLKWAYYIILIGTLLFILFEGKRKQRSIPVITPLKNQTLAFTRTISSLYFEKQQHKEIVNKQYILFLDYIRTTIRVTTEIIDEEKINTIATRSSNTIEDTQEIFKEFDRLKKSTSIQKEDLLALYDLIIKFKKIAS